MLAQEGVFIGGNKGKTQRRGELVAKGIDIGDQSLTYSQGRAVRWLLIRAS